MNERKNGGRKLRWMRLAGMVFALSLGVVAPAAAALPETLALTVNGAPQTLHRVLWEDYNYVAVEELAAVGAVRLADFPADSPVVTVSTAGEAAGTTAEFIVSKADLFRAGAAAAEVESQRLTAQNFPAGYWTVREQRLILSGLATGSPTLRIETVWASGQEPGTYETVCRLDFVTGNLLVSEYDFVTKTAADRVVGRVEGLTGVPAGATAIEDWADFHLLWQNGVCFVRLRDLEARGWQVGFAQGRITLNGAASEMEEATSPVVRPLLGWTFVSCRETETAAENGQTRRTVTEVYRNEGGATCEISYER